MMIIKMFPKKLANKRKQYTKSLDMSSAAVGSPTTQFEWCCPCLVSFIANIVVLGSSDMTHLFRFQGRGSCFFLLQQRYEQPFYSCKPNEIIAFSPLQIPGNRTVAGETVSIITAWCNFSSCHISPAKKLINLRTAFIYNPVFLHNIVITGL